MVSRFWLLAIGLAAAQAVAAGRSRASGSVHAAARGFLNASDTGLTSRPRQRNQPWP